MRNARTAIERLAPWTKTLALMLAAVGIAFSGTASRAQTADPPHWIGAVEYIDCTSACHVPHQALGGGLNPQTGNVNLCLSCHNANGRPITLAQRANPANRTGTSHNFDVSASAGLFDTVSPTDTQRSLRVQEGKLVCSTCHNQHKSEAAYGGHSRVSTAKRVKAASTPGTGTLTAGGEFTGTEASWYLVEFTVDGDETTAKFGYSKDNRATWFGCDPAACTTGGEGACAGCYTTGSPPTPADGVTFSFGAGTYKDGERWEFYAAWPFLRRTMPLNHPPDETIDSGAIDTGDKFCRDCHAAWVMTHNSGGSDNLGVRTWAAGKVMSHPVGVGLDANGEGYDRAAPLDGDGSASDSNPSNDLQRDQFGNVQCLTCHAVHYADSNSKSVDGP